MDQTAPLNGTTIKDQAWKEKKGFGRLIMVAVLLLGFAAFYAGQISGSSTVVVGGDDRGGFNGAILRGSNVQDVVEIVASASSSSSNVEADVSGKCRTSGPPPTVFTENMRGGRGGGVIPPVIYSHLNFSTGRYKFFNIYEGMDDDDGKILNLFCIIFISQTHTSHPLIHYIVIFNHQAERLISCWRRCAEKCNNEKRCRTFSAHEQSGHCYLHSDWLCEKGWRFKTGNPDVVSGVCRPEPGWYTDKSCTSF